MKNVLIAGYYGFDNTGDEAILASILEGLQRRVPGLTATVVSGNPQQTQISHGVRAVHWTDIEGIFDAARHCDLVVLGGGGLFHDYFEFDPESVLTRNYSGMAYFGSAAIIAVLFDKPLMLYSVGVGPLLTKDGQEITRAIFEMATLATVRDEESRELAATIGAPELPRVTADPVFQLTKISASVAMSQLRDVGVSIGDRCLVGVALRPWDLGPHSKGRHLQVARALDAFIDQFDADVLFIPFQQLTSPYENDIAAAREVQNAMRYSGRATILENQYTPQERAGIVGCCDLVLGMRLHSIIFASRARVPSVGIVYDPKVRNIMRQIGCEHFALDLSELSSDELFTRLKEAYQNREAIGAHLGTVANQLSALANENVELAAQILTGDVARRTTYGEHAIAFLKQAATQLSLGHDRISTRAEALIAQLAEQEQAFALEQARLQDQSNERAQELTAALDHANAERDRLSEERDRLSEERDRLSEERDRLHAELSVVYSTKAWRLTSAYWQARRQGIPGMVKFFFKGLLLLLVAPFAIPYYLVRLVYHAVIPKKLRVAFWEFRHGSGLKQEPSKLMSWYKYAFDTYKRERVSIYAADLRGLRCPYEPGLVSIILPVYNGADMLEDSLRSILRQTYTNFELIAIDDGSTDETGAILDRYAVRDARIRVIHQENRKLPRSLSRGSRVARGEFVTWTSNDNRLKPNFLEHMVASLKRHPAWDMIYANVDIIDEDGTPLRNSEWYLHYQQPSGSEHIHLPEDPSELNVWPNNYVGAAFMYRSRVAWLLGDYSPHRFTTEDYDYWMRVNDFLTLQHSDFREPVYDYRFHSKSLTSRDKELGITKSRDRLMVFEDFRRDFCLSPLLWIMDVKTSDPKTRRLISSLRQQAEGAGHIVYDLDQFDHTDFPRLWIPAVYVQTTSDASYIEEPPTEFPCSVLKTLIVTGNGLPEQVSDVWDMCLTTATSVPARRLDKAYQGWFAVSDVKALFTAVDIRARSHHLDQIEVEITQPQPPECKISVIICAYKRQERLEQAIASAASQTFCPNSYEVLIVNNDPENVSFHSAIEKLRAEHFADRPQRLRTVTCHIPGLSHARNAALAEAKGEILCFLDDDAIAAPTWLEHIWTAFESHPKAGVIGGHIWLKIPEPRPRVLYPGFEKYWSQFVTNFKEYTEVAAWWEFPWGANWCARRAVLLEIGGFRTTFGRRGRDFGGGEEVVAAALAQRMGYSVAVEPQAEALHDVEAHRYTWTHIKQTQIAGALVNYRMQKALYIPMETNIAYTVQTILRTPVDPKVDGPRKIRERDKRYRRSGHIYVLRQQMRDRRARRRKPIAVK